MVAHIIWDDGERFNSDALDQRAQTVSAPNRRLKGCASSLTSSGVVRDGSQKGVVRRQLSGQMCLLLPIMKGSECECFFRR